jgi:GNAT superfamily N-acetyltransferase
MSETTPTRDVRAKAAFAIRRARSDDLARCRQIMLNVFYQDFGYGYLPEYHKDLDDLQGHYLDRPAHILFVAEEEDTGELLGMAGVKSVRPGLAPLAPAFLVEAYDRPDVAELVRVYVDPAHRKRGVGHRLVEAARSWVAAEPTYSTLFLHTDASYPGALEFWRSHGTELYDSRGKIEGSKTLFFEIPLDKDGSGLS